VDLQLQSYFFRAGARPNMPLILDTIRHPLINCELLGRIIVDQTEPTIETSYNDDHNISFSFLKSPEEFNSQRI
jgi:hypothetical protein